MPHLSVSLIKLAFPLLSGLLQHFMEYHVKDPNPCYLIYTKIRESTPQRLESPGTLDKASWWAQLCHIAVPKEYLRAQVEGMNLGSAKGEVYGPVLGVYRKTRSRTGHYMWAFINYWNMWWVIGKE